jgi:hypothetical protein
VDALVGELGRCCKTADARTDDQNRAIASAHHAPPPRAADPSSQVSRW